MIRVRASRGFTLVELLIVIVVIAILAAITIVAYGGVTSRAQAATLQSDLSQAKTFLEGYLAQNGTYPADLPTAHSAGLKISSGDTLTYTVNNSVNPATYTLTATNSTQNYFVNNTSQTSPQSGITNFIPNPAFRSDTNNWGSWSYPGGSAVASRVTTGGPTAALPDFWRLTISTTPTGSPANVPTAYVPVAPGATYCGSAYVRYSAALANGPRLDIFAKDASGVNTTLQGPTQSVTVGSWGRIYQCATMPATTATAAIVVEYSGPTTLPVGATLDVTGAMFTQGSTLYNYADGATTGWVWGGLIDESPSSGPAV